MQAWAAQEVQSAALGDPRRTRRFVRLLEALAAQPQASVPRACGSWAATKAAYRFWDNPHISAAAIRAAHSDATRQRLPAHEPLLILQDTTEFDWSHHPATSGLGPLSASTHHGFHVHSCLAVTTEGVPLGILDQYVWARDPAQKGIRHTRRKRPTALKESQRWIDALDATVARVPEQSPIIVVADREADIFDLFAHERRSGVDLLIRACYNRKVRHPQNYLWQAVEAAPVQGERKLSVGRTPLREPREVTLRLRWLAVELLPPRNQVQRTHRDPVPVVAVFVDEVDPPQESDPIKWLLVSSYPVSDNETAWQLVDWYRRRWLIERYHYVLKSGCKLEELQLHSGAQLERALATYSIVAWRLLWLTYEARVHPDQPCTIALESDEWQALLVSRSKHACVPTTPPTLREAVRFIAQLGGFLARKGDGEPGVKTIWQGLQRLQDLAFMWRAARSSDTPPTCG